MEPSRIIASAWRYQPHTYAQRVSQGGAEIWLPYKHLVSLSRFITPRIMAGKARIVVSMPPRHGKSEFTSNWLPTWYLDNFPKKRVILCSYEASFAAEWGAKVRHNLENNPFCISKVNPEKRAANNFLMAKGGQVGGMKTAGVAGPITGKGADLFIIDDAIKNDEEARSPERRDKHKKWWRGTAKTRLEPGASVICIMTRWWEDDLAGFLIDEFGFDEFRMPAICEDEDDRIGRKLGEALCPERYPIEELIELREEDPQGFNGLYQQRPSNEEGNMLKRDTWSYYDKLPETRFFKMIIQSWDMTFKDAATSDYVVGLKLGWLHGTNDFYIIDFLRGQWGLTETVKRVLTMTSNDPKSGYKLIENKANGPAVEDVLRNKISGIKLIEPSGSKDARVASIEHIQQTGHIYLPNPATHNEYVKKWVKHFIEECASFPRGKNDDCPDTLSQGIHFLDSRARSSIYALSQL